jgi:hypothetical protein
MAMEENDEGSKLLKFIEKWAISPQDAKEIARKYRRQAEAHRPGASSERYQEWVADKIIARYARLAAMSGGATSLTGVVPGLGTALAVLGGGLADTAVCMKLQVDMTCCLAEAFGYDLNKQDARDLAFLIAAGGALEKAGEQLGVRLASKAGVRMVRQYLKGAALQAVKQFFRRIGIVFTRKALEKAIPFGFGVFIGAGANYALTKYVGAQARDWFVIDRDMLEPEPGEASAA